MSRLHVSFALMLGLILGSPTQILAQNERGAPIHLDADHADIDANTGVGIYTGNVILTQGRREITGDRMTVHTRGNRELDHVVVEGNPATWRQPPEGGGEEILGEAPRMEYHTRNPEHVKLLEGGRVTRGRNVFTGETIEYNLETERVVARGRDATERIRITLFPDDEENE